MHFASGAGRPPRLHSFTSTINGARRDRFRKGPWTAALLLLLAAEAACEKPAPLPPLPPPAVKVSAVQRSGVARELRLSGSLEAERSTLLSFATPGTIERVLVQEGEAVVRGQPIARLSARTFQDALAMVKAKADQAEDAYRRLEPMHRNQTLPEVKMVEVESGRQQARLAVSIAQKNLDDTVLRSPEAGIVARRHLEPGATAAPGVPVITLVQTRTVLAVVPVAETQVARVKKGDPARVSVAAVGKTLDGVVRDVGVMADPLTRTYPVRIALANPGDLRVGMVAQVHLNVASGAQDLLVPTESVRVDDAGRPYVFVVTAEQKLQRRRVEVVGFAGEGTAVSAGVSEGERVVTSGTPMLADSMAVRVVGQGGKEN